MRKDTQTRPLFHRLASLESFTKFLCRGQLQALEQFDPVKRRRGKQGGLEGFLWLGLLVSAYGAMNSLSAIFKQIGLVLSNGASLPVKMVAVSAFCQYRLRVSLCFMRRLWAALVDQARQAVAQEYARWHGLRLWAMDGTALRVDEALWPYFRDHRGCRGDGPAQAHLVVLYDLHARTPSRMRVGPYDKKKERAVAPRLISGLGPGDLVLMDGGFYSIRLFGRFQERGVHFVVPMRKNGKPKRIRRLGRGDGLYEILASKSYWKDTPGAGERMTVRIVEAHRKGFRPRRLVTDLLDAEAYPAEEIVAVYDQRWHIETFYREIKQVMKLEQWHARTVHSFYCELLFAMILATLTRLAMADAARGRCPPGQLSFKKSLEWMQIAVVVSATVPTHQWPQLYDELLLEIARCTIDIRPGRHYERNRQKRRKQSRTKRLAALTGATS